MKQKILLFNLLTYLFLISVSSTAQITITADEFERMGDFKTYNNAAINTVIELPTEGENQSWDYSGLIAGSEIATQYLDASNNEVFPEATSFVRAQTRFQTFDVNEVVFEKVTDEGWFGLGTIRPEQTFDVSSLTGSPGDIIEFGGVSYLDGEEKIVGFPMNYADKHSSNFKTFLPYKLSVAQYGLDQVPGERILTYTIESEVVGHGQLIIPDIAGNPSKPMNALLLKANLSITYNYNLGGQPAPGPLLEAFLLEQGSQSSETQYAYFIEGYNAPVLFIGTSEFGIESSFRPRATIDDDITITKETFDRIGNYIDTIITVEETEVAFPAHGSQQVWDYSNLTPKDIRIVEHFDASQSSAFPNTTGYYNNDLQFQNFIIENNTYERVDNSAWSIIGHEIEDVTYPITAISGGPDDILRFVGGNFQNEGKNEALKFPLTKETSWNSLSKETLPFELTVTGFGLSNIPGTRQRTKDNFSEVVGTGQALLPSVNGVLPAPIDAILLKYTNTTVDSFFLGGVPAPADILTAFGLVQGATTIQNHYNLFSPDYNSAILFVPIDFEQDISFRLKGFQLEDAKTIYVNKEAAIDGDGRSWESAYKELSTALQSYNKGDEIWVAKGTYSPLPQTGTPDYETKFLINKDVALYGGFDGTETSRDQRNSEINVTILSGDLEGDDIPDDFDQNKFDNSINVVFLEAATTKETIIDGFSISGGYALGNADVFPDSRGAGLWSYGAATVNNCVFVNNIATNNGGGAYFYRTASEGSVISNCTFIRNAAGENGGGMSIADIEDNVFTFDNCTFSGNTCGVSGGGLITIRTNVEIKNCTFENNISIESGGGLTISHGLDGYTALVDSCIARGNTSTLGGGIEIATFGIGNTTLIKNSHISENISDALDPGFPDYGGGGIRFQILNTNNEFMVDNCIIENNNSTLHGGGIGVSTNTSTIGSIFTLQNSIVRNNNADDNYGGMGVANLDAELNLRVINTEFSNNTAPIIPGFFIGNPILTSMLTANIKLINSTFTNHGNATGSVIGFQDHNLDLLSCTIADNESNGIGIFTNSTLDIRNNIIQTGTFSNFFEVSDLDEPINSRGGNLLSDNTISEWVNSNDKIETEAGFLIGTYELSEDSPAIDAGILDEDLTDLDIAGNERIQGGCIDIGAYESSFDSGGSCITTVNDVILSSESISLFPNPTSDITNITTSVIWHSDIQVTVYNNMGQKVAYKVIDLTKSNQVITLDTGVLLEGNYRVVMSDGNVIGIKSFTKI